MQTDMSSSVVNRDFGFIVWFLIFKNFPFKKPTASICDRWFQKFIITSTFHQLFVVSVFSFFSCC